MGDRMTSAEAKAWASKATHNSDYHALSRAADALAAWEAEDAARAGMPELLAPWAVIGGGEIWRRHDSKEAAVAEAKGIGNARAVRLAVVEVAEPEPPRPVPVRVVGPSGWEYERDQDGVRIVEPGIGDIHLWTNDSTDTRIPPADRALVARLLGEVA